MKKYYNRNTLLLLSISLLIIILAGTSIWNNSIWGDEGYTIRLIKGSFSELIAETSIDVHPPLYYFIAKILCDIFGYTIPLLKIISLIPIAILLMVGSTKIQKEFGFLSGLSFIILVGLPPSMVYHLEIRMYSWAMLFVTLCVLFLYEILKYNKSISWWGLVITGLAAAYTHYYALITVAFLYVSLFVIMIIRSRSNLKQCICYSLITIVGYLPWLFILLAQFSSVSESYWIPPISWKDIEIFIWFVIGAERIMWATIILLLLATCFFFFKGDKFQITNNKKLIVIICFVGFLGNIGLGLAVSFLIKPLFYARYIYVGIGLLWLGFSITLSHGILKKKAIRICFIILLCLAGFLNFQNFYEKEQVLAEGTLLTEEFAEGNIFLEDIIVSNKTHFTWTVLEVYFPENQIVTYEEMNWAENEDRVWIYSETLELSIKEELQEENYTIQYIMEGLIDGENYFLYCVEK